MSETLATEVFREAQDAIPVRQPRVDAVIDRARAERGRRRKWAIGIAAGIAGALAIGTWLGTRPADPDLPEPVVQLEQNPADVEWYANGALHLSDVTVGLPSVQTLVRVTGGVVYGDQDGRVVQVTPDGDLSDLGRTVPGAPLVGSDRGWVAWVDPGEDSPELVVHDTLDDEVIGRRSLPYAGDRWEESDERSHPVAIDQGIVYFAAQDGDWAWRLPDGEPERVNEGDLLDVASAVRVARVYDGWIRIVQPLFNIEHRLPGTGAMLSEDGDYVLTRTDDLLPGSVRIYDTASGEQLETGLGAGDSVLAATLGPDDTVTYVVRSRSNAPPGDPGVRLSTSGPVELRTCGLDEVTGACRTVTEFSFNRAVPVLPQ